VLRCSCLILAVASLGSSQTSSWGKKPWFPHDSSGLCRHKPLSLPKSARYGKVEEYSARPPILTADRARSWGSHLIFLEWSTVLRLPNACRHPSILLVCVSCWHDGMAWNRPSRLVVLDPPKVGYWMDSSKWDLDGRRAGKAETMADSRNPRKTCTHVGLGQRLSACEPRRKGRAESQAMIWSQAGVAGGFSVTRRTANVFPSSWSLPKRKGCDICDTCNRLLPRRYTGTRSRCRPSISGFESGATILAA
jgi:hypothetical protein